MIKKYVDLKMDRTALRDAVPLDMPFTLFVDPSNYCNFKCSFCPRNQKDFTDYAGPYTHMTKELFRKIADDLQEFKGKLKVLRLFYLGEPLLCPDFLDILKIACEENIAERIEVSTNASLLTQDYGKSILDIVKNYPGYFYLRVSIYSVYQQKNESITKNKISVEQLRNNVAKFYELKNSQKDFREHVKIYVKMLKSYSDEDEDFKRIYSGIADEVELEEPMEWSGDQDRNLLSGVYEEGIVSSLRKKVMPSVCAYPFHTMAIQSDGKVVCCCVDWSRRTYIGDVSKESLYDIWHGSLMRTIRLAHLAGKRSQIESCRNCLKLPTGGVYDYDNLDSLTVSEYVEREKKGSNR